MTYLLPASMIAVTVFLIAMVTAQAIGSVDADRPAASRSLLVALLCSASLAAQVAALCSVIAKA